MCQHGEQKLEAFFIGVPTKVSGAGSGTPNPANLKVKCNPASGSIRGGLGQGQRLPGVCRAETWVDYLERAQGLDTEAVSLGYLLGRIGHHKAYEAGLTAGAY